MYQAYILYDWNMDYNMYDFFCCVCIRNIFSGLIPWRSQHIKQNETSLLFLHFMSSAYGLSYRGPQFVCIGLYILFECESLSYVWVPHSVSTGLHDLFEFQTLKICLSTSVCMYRAIHWLCLNVNILHLCECISLYTSQVLDCVWPFAQVNQSVGQFTDSWAHFGFYKVEEA